MTPFIKKTLLATAFIIAAAPVHAHDKNDPTSVDGLQRPSPLKPASNSTFIGEMLEPLEEQVGTLYANVTAPFRRSGAKMLYSGIGKAIQGPLYGLGGCAQAAFSFRHLYFYDVYNCVSDIFKGACNIFKGATLTAGGVTEATCGLAKLGYAHPYETAAFVGVGAVAGYFAYQNGTAITNFAGNTAVCGLQFGASTLSQGLQLTHDALPENGGIAINIARSLTGGASNVLGTVSANLPTIAENAPRLIEASAKAGSWMGSATQLGSRFLSATSNGMKTIGSGVQFISY